MSTKHLYIAVGILAVALIGGMVLHAYVSSAVEAARADQVKDDVTKQIASMRGDLKDALLQIAQDKQISQPHEIVQKLPQYIELPKPILLQGPQTEPSRVPSNSLPDAPSAVQTGALIIPSESVSAFWQHETSCKEDAVKLGECQKELPLLTQRAEAAEKAMKGGGFWRRLKANSKWFVIGGTVGAGAVLATRR